jgi:hypothetical protein
MGTALDEMMAAARACVRAHTPTGTSTTCRACTLAGVGSHGAPVGAPCVVYEMNVQFLARHEQLDPAVTEAGLVWARAIAAAHYPTGAAPGLCPRCGTAWMCRPYRAAARMLKAAGEYRPPPNGDGEVGK